MAGVFHQYDIRGVYNKEISEKFAYTLGKAILKYTKAKKILIGYDSRISNLKLFSSLSKSIIDEGISVVHAGIVTRPMLNYISWKKGYDLGIMITASHNPKEYNGFKFIWKGKQLHYGNGLNDVEKIFKTLSRTKFKTKSKKGKIVSIDYIDDYVKFLSSKLDLKKKNLRIVADASNGSAGEIIKRLLLKNGIVFKLINDEPNGEFPAHDPNPLHVGSMVQLSKAVIDFKADFGFIVDPDADRIRFVDEHGDVISNNYADSLIVENLPKGSAVIYDITSRKILPETLARKKLKGIVSKVGTANVIDNMVKYKAVFGSETSGHRYYKEMNNQDSGLMTFVKVLSIAQGKKLSKLLAKYHKYVDMHELNYTVKKDKAAIIANVKKYYENKSERLGVEQISMLDGLRVDCADYWFTLRVSNTENLLRLRIEGLHKKKLLLVKKELEKFF